MDYVRLGKSGLEVSRIVLGCMSFGDPARGHHAWALGLDEARPLIRQALDAGITTFDTANTYSLGASEEIVGTVIAEAGVRDEVLVATKVFGRMSCGPKGGGLSRAAIVAQVDASLRRLGTDYIDLYDPPTRSRRTDRGSPCSAPRSSARGEGALCRGVIHGRLAVRPGPVRGRPAWLHSVRVHAGPVQPTHEGRGAGDASLLYRSGHRRAPLEFPGPRTTRPPTRSDHCTQPNRCVRRQPL